jgi:hypothetical protein
MKISKNKAIEGNNFFKQFSYDSICSPINNLVFNNDGRAWLNPSDQQSFNSGWFEKQDFLDWLEGKGKIVKGKTNKEKLLFWNHAKFLKEYNHGWMIACNYNYFNLVADYNPNSGFEKYNENPLVIKTKNKEEIISKVLSSFKNYIKEDFKYRKFEDVQKEYKDVFYGAKKTLIMLGCGYFGACNTPCQVENLSWFGDVVITKAYYEHLLIEGVVMPDFDFVRENKYKY